MNTIATQLQRIRSGSLLSFSKQLKDLEIDDRIDVMLELMLFDAGLSEKLIADRAGGPGARHTALPAVSTKVGSGCFARDPVRGLLAPKFFPAEAAARIMPIACS